MPSSLSANQVFAHSSDAVLCASIDLALTMAIFCSSPGRNTSAADRSTTTVVGSGALTDLMLVMMLAGPWLMPLTRLMLATTSALVKSAPLWNFTPVRSLNVYWVLVLFTVQLWASDGFGSTPPGSYMVSES